MLSIKSITLFSSWLIAFFIGRMALSKNHSNHAWISGHKINHLTDGIFLGIALCHLIPEAIEGFQSTLPALFIAGFTFALLQGFIWLHAKWHIGKRSNICYFDMLFIGLHAVTEGFILSMVNHKSHLLVLCAALLIHKGAESYAVMHSMMQQGISYRKGLIMTIIFASLTPLGGILYFMGHHTFFINMPHAFEASLNAIAAGTFIFMAFSCQTCLPDATTHHCKTQQTRSIHYLLAGFLLMFMVSQAGAHHHEHHDHTHHNHSHG